MEWKVVLCCRCGMALVVRVDWRRRRCPYCGYTCSVDRCTVKAQRLPLSECSLIARHLNRERLLRVGGFKQAVEG